VTKDLEEAEKLWRALGAGEVMLQDMIKPLEFQVESAKRADWKRLERLLRSGTT
jgi:hypothetical protein